jgi:hypothetical protein
MSCEYVETFWKGTKNPNWIKEETNSRLNSGNASYRTIRNVLSSRVLC